MLSAVLGLFSQDLAIDLGTTTTRIHQRGCGLVVREPTVVAVHTDGYGRRRVVAVGEPAARMVGRTPRGIEAIEPVREGLIEDFEVAEALLMQLLARCHGANALVAPEVVVAVPYGISDMARRAVRDSCEASGARQVSLVPRPLAAALGADLCLEADGSHLIVDVGGGTTELAILDGEQVAACTTVGRGGRGFDEAIIAWLAEHHDLLVGRPSAEALRIDIGAAVGTSRDAKTAIKGRCLRDGLPRSLVVEGADVSAVLSPLVEDIGLAMRRLISDVPGEIAADVVRKGALLTGGASRLPGLERALRRKAGVPVVRDENPDDAVARGACLILEDHSMLSRMAA